MITTTQLPPNIIYLIQGLYPDCTWQEAEAAFKELTEREQRVLILRYGLAGETLRSLAAIGEMLGRSRGRIWQIQGKAFRKIRGHIRYSRYKEGQGDHSDA